MTVLAIRTDKPEAELYLINEGRIIDEIKWTAHRQLAETIHHKINELLERQVIRMESLAGILVYEGPGSFTGLRIGISVANALAYGLSVPNSGATGENWLSTKVDQKPFEPIVPQYGSEPHITAQKK